MLIPLLTPLVFLRRPPRTSILHITFGLSTAFYAHGKVALSDFDEKVAPVFNQYCVECHSADNDQGAVDLISIHDAVGMMKDLSLLRRVYDVIDLEDMPPVDKPQLSPDEYDNVIEWLEFASEDGILEIPKDAGPGIIRRLSREEYSRTVRDIFAVEYNVSEEVGMPPDPVDETFHFENLASVLQVEPLMLEKYFDAAVDVVDLFFYKSPEGKRAVQTIMASIGKSDNPKQRRHAAAQNFQGLLWRIFRRPPTQGELARYMTVWDDAVSKDISETEAFKHMLIASLISPNFLYRIEENQAPSGSLDSYPVKPYELATRLSYFLWSSMPDGPLFKAAHDGTLTDPVVLEQQVRRMLAHPKAEALSEVFASQWFKLKMLEDARPSQEYFPEYSVELRDSMYREPIVFFKNLIEVDGSIDDIIDSDYTFVDSRLAEFYGIEGVTGDKFVKVDIPEGMPRGGLMGMGSVLSMNSHVSRTSPTLRGTYVLKVMLGQPPPPPPANASQIASDVSENIEINSFRDLLAAHAQDFSCAGCHKRIDPLGFALDNFDAIGRWRESTEDEPIDTSGILPDGQRLNSFDDVKLALSQRREQVYLNVAEQMLRFALGRHLQTADRQIVNDIVDRMKATDGSIHELILSVVNSFPFLNRRNTTPAATATVAIYP